MRAKVRARRPGSNTLTQPLGIPVRRAFRLRGTTAHAVLPGPRGWKPLCMSSVADDPMGSPAWRGWETPELIAQAAELPTCQHCADAIPARL